MKKARKIFATLSLSAMMLNAVALPISATSNGIDLSVIGNGVESDNEIIVHSEQDTNVSQSNEFNVNNNINASASTGGNSASSNTGGDGLVDTGNATSNVTVTNAGNSNEAVVDCCNAAQGVSVMVDENGDSSDNKVVLSNDNKIKLDQENKSNVVNNVDNDASSGWNRADRNTGGSMTVKTGNASATTTVSTGGNVNSAMVGGGEGGSYGVSAIIRGNGVHSDNDIWLNLEHDVEVEQYNSARVRNDIDTDAVTGKNSASRNTGGDVLVDTGDATVDVMVDNAVNFNFADVDCGCLFDVTAKIAENGDSSDNNIKAILEDDLEVAQDNKCEQRGYQFMPVLFGKTLSRFLPDGYGRGGDCLTNDIYADAYSGWNKADRNTGAGDSDPSVYTGNADTTVDVINAGNSNVFGEAAGWEFPEDEGQNSNVNVNISFDLLSLLGMLGLNS